MMKLVSFNMQNRSGEHAGVRQARRERIATLLNSLEPGIVCLQECLLEDFEFFSSALEAKQSGFTPRDDGDRLGEGNPIFLLSHNWKMVAFQTFWLSGTPDVPSRSWRSAHHRIASVMKLQEAGQNNRVLNVLNVHLDHRSGLARRKSLVLIRRELRKRASSPDDAFVVCGDFNMRPQRLHRTGFTWQDLDPSAEFPIILEDAAKSAPRLGAAPTFRGIGPWRLFRRRLDYCLHTTNFRCLDYLVVDPLSEGLWLSDHRVVVAAFS